MHDFIIQKSIVLKVLKVEDIKGHTAFLLSTIRTVVAKFPVLLNPSQIHQGSCSGAQEDLEVTKGALYWKLWEVILKDIHIQRKLLDKLFLGLFILHRQAIGDYIGV